MTDEGGINDLYNRIFVEHVNPITRGKSTKQLIDGFAMTDHLMDTFTLNEEDYQVLVEVRGWIMDVLAEREPESMERWTDTPDMTMEDMFHCFGVAPLGECQWFLYCGRDATHMEPHPILGHVPTCDNCKMLIERTA